MCSFRSSWILRTTNLVDLTLSVFSTKLQHIIHSLYIVCLQNSVSFFTYDCVKNYPGSSGMIVNTHNYFKSFIDHRILYIYFYFIPYDCLCVAAVLNKAVICSTFVYLLWKKLATMFSLTVSSFVSCLMLTSPILKCLLQAM